MEFFGKDTDIEVWQKVLDADMHLHMGDAGVHDKFVNTIKNRKHHLAGCNTLLDVGAGWGGTGKLLEDEGFDVTVVTNEEIQGEVCDAKGLDTILTDAAQFTPTKNYDAITFFDSLSYINYWAGINKSIESNPLKRYYEHTDRILIVDFMTMFPRMNFSVHEAKVKIQDRAKWQQQVEDAGFTVKYFENDFDRETVVATCNQWLENIRRKLNGTEKALDDIFNLFHYLKALSDDETQSPIRMFTLYAEKE